MLPHGARGIDLEGLSAVFCSEKVIAFKAGDGEHYTLHTGWKSGIIDVHRTWKGPEGTENHQTIFAMRRDAIPAVCRDLASIEAEFIGLFRRLRLGWLKHRGICVVRGCLPTTSDEICKVTKKRRGRLVFIEEEVRDQLYVPEYLDEIFEFPDGAFGLFKSGKNIGIGLKVTYQLREPQFYWIKMKDLSRFSGMWSRKILQVFMRHKIPPDQYSEHDVLRPSGS